MLMTRRTAVSLLAGTALTACGSGETERAKATQAGLRDLSESALDQMARLSPTFATWLGDHRFDSQVDDLSAAGRAASAAFRADIDSKIAGLSQGALTAGEQVDLAILANRSALEGWSSKAETHVWDPIPYSEVAGGALYGLVAREFAPLPERLLAAAARMAALPAVFAAARAQLDPARTPKVHAETYARQHPGIMGLVDGVILKQAEALGPADQATLKAAAEGLRKAAAEHEAWIKSTLVPKAAGDFRIGQALYDEKLGLALASPMTRADIKTKALEALERTTAEMAELAGKALGKAAPRDRTAAIKAGLEKAYAERPNRAQVVDVARQTLERSTAFVRQKDLITLPDAPVEIIIMPEFQRGVAVAYCDSPGPLDKGQKTFYAVSPIPDDWTNAQATSFLREYNTRSLHELTIHEAMPGHYVQIWHSNRYQSVLRAALYSGTFVEGWACYAQDMMGEEGYYEGDVLGDLINRKWRLRLISNALLDQGVHVDGMTREQAMALMVEGAFQEEREAAGKWVRAQVSSTQLSTYFVGWAEHYALRDRLKAHWKENFGLKRYHDSILAFGSPPTKHVAALLFGEPITT
jgi:uncharacterized protein (DUF885 family)